MKVCPTCGKEKRRLCTSSECESCYLRRRRKEKPEYYKAKELKSYKKNRDKKLRGMLAYRQKNLDRLREHDRTRWRLDESRRKALTEYRETHRGRVRETDRLEYRRNRDRHIARVMARRGYKGKATPKWLTKEHHEAIRALYANRPDGYHVDHIIPLKGKNVCGLHVPWNLQYLLAEVNLKKRNKLCPQST